MCVVDFLQGIRLSCSLNRGWPTFLQSEKARSISFEAFTLYIVVVLMSILLAEHYLLPMLDGIQVTIEERFAENGGGQSYMQGLRFAIKATNLLSSFIYYAFWLIPVCIGVSLPLSAEYAVTCAEEALKIQTSNGKIGKDLPNKFADLLYDLIVVGTFPAIVSLIDAVNFFSQGLEYLAVPLQYIGISNASAFVSYLVHTIPFLLGMFSFCCWAWLYSYWTFSAVWKVQGMRGPMRLREVESNWAFYLGFGFALTLLSYFVSYFVFAALYYAAFPWLVMVAATAAAAKGKDDMPTALESRMHLPVFFLPRLLVKPILSLLRIHPST